MNPRKWMTVLLIMYISVSFVFADSLFDEGTYRALAVDARAIRPGDSLTVIIVETSTSQTKANTATNKDASIFSVRTKSNDTRTFDLSLGDEFDGGGRIDRTGKLLAKLSVTVQSVEPNGELRIRGEQAIEVNDEKQFIALEGKVRPEDVSANNTVLSTRISEARISYTGKGILAEKQRPGILTRFLSWLRLI